MMTIERLRQLVVAQAKMSALSSLAAQASRIEEALRSTTTTTTTAPRLSQRKRDALSVKLSRLRGDEVAQIEARFEDMAKPGVVMGEEELQALADLRGACIQVIILKFAKFFNRHFISKTFRSCS